MSRVFRFSHSLAVLGLLAALGVQAAATADVEHTLAGQADGVVDPVQAQGVDIVQRLEFAVRIPPAVGEFSKFVEFGLVGVEHDVLQER